MPRPDLTARPIGGPNPGESIDAWISRVPTPVIPCHGCKECAAESIEQGEMTVCGECGRRHSPVVAMAVAALMNRALDLSADLLLIASEMDDEGDVIATLACDVSVVANSLRLFGAMAAPAPARHHHGDGDGPVAA